MSFDELPPDSEPTRQGAEVTPPTEQEASNLDAPPAGAVRRRRAANAGPDAASTEVSAETKPRTRRTRLKAASLDPQTSEEQAEPTREPGSPEAESAPRVRRTRRPSPTSSGAEATPESGADPASNTAPAAKPRRGSRTGKPVRVPVNDVNASAPAAVEAPALSSAGEPETSPSANAAAVAVDSPSDDADGRQGAASVAVVAGEELFADRRDEEPGYGDAPATFDGAAVPIVAADPDTTESAVPAPVAEEAGANDGVAQPLSVSGLAEVDEETVAARLVAAVGEEAKEEENEEEEDAAADPLAAESPEPPVLPAPAIIADVDTGVQSEIVATSDEGSAELVSVASPAETAIPIAADLEAGAALTETVVEPEPLVRAEQEDDASDDIDMATETDDEAAPVGLDSAAVTPRSRSRRNRDRRARRDTLRQEPTAPEPAPAARAEPPVAAPPPARAVINTSVGAHLVYRNGVLQIQINGMPFAPILFFGNMDGTRNQQRVLSEVRRAARAGIHLHSTIVELPCPLSEATEALDEIDRNLRAILDADPQGFVMPRIVFIPARGWKREYPTDIATYTDGASADPSLTSERFWREAEHSLEILVHHLREYEWGGRIFGYHLERGEWFQPADSGFDRSMANREAFRDWLRERYKGSLVALRAAWYDANVQFHTAEIPPVPTKPNPQRAFFETRRERRIIDFYTFTSESTARRLAGLARGIKAACDNQALVSVCYGYTLEFGHGFSGHLALAELLTCPDINLICGPPSYRDRKPGGASSFPGPVDSLALHGKLWLSEDDTKTFLSPAQQEADDYNPRLPDRYQTEQAHARAMGRSLATLTGIGFMDLWGEGWLDDDGLWDRISAFADRYTAVLRNRTRRPSAEVVVLIDEKSLLHVQKGEAFFRKLTNGLRDLLQKAGISYSTYLQSDLLSPNFPTDAKLYLFLNPYRLTSGQRAAVKEKLQGGNRTLAWLYAPGSCEERPLAAGAMEETATGAVGITLRQQEWNSEIGSRIIDQRHPITERVTAKEIGVRERLNPSFFVDDTEATVLAEYQGSGLPSIAVKRCGTWQSVFVGEPVLTAELLRGICKFAGVHLWTGAGDDVTFVGNGVVTIHASRDGHRALRLPSATGLYDLGERRLIGDEVREHRFFMKAGVTRTYLVGTVEYFQQLQLQNLQIPESSRPRPVESTLPSEPLAVERPIAERPAPERTAAERPAPEIQAPVKDLPATLSDDMLTLQAVLSLDLTKIEDLPLDTIEGYEINKPPTDARPLSPDAGARLAELLPNAGLDPQSRRRRRRGGRGRGRRRADGTKIEETTAPAVGADGLPVATPSQADDFIESALDDAGDFDDNLSDEPFDDEEAAYPTAANGVEFHPDPFAEPSDEASDPATGASADVSQPTDAVPTADALSDDLQALPAPEAVAATDAEQQTPAEHQAEEQPEVSAPESQTADIEPDIQNVEALGTPQALSHPEEAQTASSESEPEYAPTLPGAASAEAHDEPEALSVVDGAPPGTPEQNATQQDAGASPDPTPPAETEEHGEGDQRPEQQTGHSEETGSQETSNELGREEGREESREDNGADIDQEPR